MPGSWEEDFLRNTEILHFLPKNYVPFGWGVMKFIISGLLPLIMLHTKFGKDWPGSFWGEDINARRTKNAKDAWRRTPTHSNRSPEWLRWPKNIMDSLSINFCLLSLLLSYEERSEEQTRGPWATSPHLRKQFKQFKSIKTYDYIITLITVIYGL